MPVAPTPQKAPTIKPVAAPKAPPKLFTSSTSLASTLPKKPSPVPGPVPTPVTAPAAPTRPAFNWQFGSLDKTGENDVADLTANYTKARGDYDAELKQALNETAAQRIRAQQQADQGFLNADNNAAARGMFFSGIRDKNRGQVSANLVDQRSAADARSVAAQNAWDRAMKQLEAMTATGRNRAADNSAQRAWQAYLEQHGGL